MTDQLPSPLLHSAANNQPDQFDIRQRLAEYAQQPELVAIASEHGHLSYAQLFEQACGLAGLLQRLGVGPEVAVVFCLPRSNELVLSMLAIVLAGAAYVPCDPAYPNERLATILADTAAPILIIHSSLLHKITVAPAHVLVIDQLNRADQALASYQPQGLNPQQLAYIIYTSGSTGKPKGVQISHGNLRHLIAWHLQAFPIAPNDQISQIAGSAFDACTWEIWPALLSGACVQIVPDELRTDPQQLQGWLLEQQIRSGFVPTPLAERLIQLPWPAASKLQTLLTGGEQLLQAPTTKLPFQLINNYGPTETTVVATSGLVEATSPTIPSIGKAILGANIYILNQQLQPVAAAELGELYIGGAGVGRGYLGLPGLTAERFMPDPFSNQPGARMYRSGDQARWNADGTVEYLGRIDQQVKIRGFRIELGEIEAVLKRQPAVAAAAVIVDQTTPTKRLLGYIVPTMEHELDLITLQASLALHLPAYMLPQQLIVLADLPLTPNGKVDRQRLPIPQQPALASSELPQTATEQALVLLWQELLGLQLVGRESHFFQLGGDSLSATQLLLRLRQTVNRDLPLHLIFDYPNLWELAAQLDQQKNTTTQAVIQPIKRSQRMPLAFAQQRVWFFEQLVPNTAMYTIGLQLKLSGKLEPALLQQAINQLVARHELLRASFHEHAGNPWMQIAEQLTLDLELIDLRGLTIEQQSIDVQKINQRLAYASYQLDRAPLLRFCLIQLGEQSAIIVMTIQHSIADAWSVDLLLQELFQIYTALADKRPLNLAELPVQFVDFAAWHAAWLTTAAAQQQLNYWLEQLADAPRLLALPTDYPRPATQSFAGAVLSVELAQNLTHELRNLSQRQNVTLFMLLLAAFKSLLYRYTGQTDLCVGSPIANRSQPELQSLIGFFINTLVLRSTIQPNWSFLDLLAAVRATTLAAYGQQDVPLEKIIEQLKLERDLSYNPLFQVMFNFRHDFSINRQFSIKHQNQELQVEAEMLANGTSKFDLTLDVADRGSSLLLWVEYNSALFTPATIERLLEQFQILLGSICAQPEQQLNALEMRTAKHIAQLEHDRTAVLAQLEQHPAISQVIVLARPDLPQVNRLAGYLVKHPDQVLELEQLQTSLQTCCQLGQLALYELPTMPLDAAGEVDRHRLSSYDQPPISQQSNQITAAQPSIEPIQSSMLAEKRAKLSAEKRALLEKRLKQLRGE